MNPLPGGSDYTNPRKARYFISIGRAEPAGPCAIRFISPSELRIQVTAAVKIARAKMGISYTDPEAGGLATVDQIQGIPMAGPAQKMVRIGPPRFKPRALKRGIVRYPLECRGTQQVAG